MEAVTQPRLALATREAPARSITRRVQILELVAESYRILAPKKLTALLD